MGSPRKRTLPGGNLLLTKIAERPQIDFEIEFFEELIRRMPDYVEALAVLSANLREKGQLRECVKLDQKRIELRPTDARCHYSLACRYAVLGQRELAFASLQRAVHLGLRDLNLLSQEADLSPLRTDPRFNDLLKRG